jgi:hypothetical protein
MQRMPHPTCGIAGKIDPEARDYPSLGPPSTFAGAAADKSIYAASIMVAGKLVVTATAFRSTARTGLWQRCAKADSYALSAERLNMTACPVRGARWSGKNDFA